MASTPPAHPLVCRVPPHGHTALGSTPTRAVPRPRRSPSIRDQPPRGRRVAATAFSHRPGSPRRRAARRPRDAAAAAAAGVPATRPRAHPAAPARRWACGAPFGARGFAPARVPARLVRYARALATNDTTAAAATTLARGAAPPRRGGHGHNRTAHGKRPWLLPGRGWPRRPLSPAPRRVDAPGPPRIGGPAHATAIIACSDASHAPCGGACRGCGDGSHSCAEAGGRTPRLAEPHHSSAEADGPMPTARSVMPAPVGPTMHNRRRGQRRILWPSTRRAVSPPAWWSGTHPGAPPERVRSRWTAAARRPARRGRPSQPVCPLPSPPPAPGALPRHDHPFWHMW